MADLKKVLEKLKEEDPEKENWDIEELSEEEAGALGGGTNSSCPVTNSSCPNLSC
jgi:hypothetical protein